MEEKICPICKQKYKGQPAISRKDNKTEICSSCGTTQAILEYYKFILKGGKE